MAGKLDSPVHLRYEPIAACERPMVFRVYTIDCLNEVAALFNHQTGHLHFIDEDEFRHAMDAERLTDSMGLVGMAWHEESAFYICVE